MILEKNNLQTAQEWTKSYIELIASYVHPKNSINHLRSHLRAIMALDYRRVIRPGKKAGRIFLRSTSLLYKIFLTNLGACKPTFYTIYTTHLLGETVPWGTVFIIQTWDRMQYFTILQHKLHSFYIQDDQSTGGLLAKPLKKFPKSPTASRSHFCSASRVECLIQLRPNIIMVLSVCVIFKSVWYARHLSRG